jgi:hypothetical protein
MRFLYLRNIKIRTKMGNTKIVNGRSKIKLSKTSTFLEKQTNDHFTLLQIF